VQAVEEGIEPVYQLEEGEMQDEREIFVKRPEKFGYHISVSFNLGRYLSCLQSSQYRGHSLTQFQ